MPHLQVGGHKGGKVYWAFVDDEDFERVNQYKWTYNNQSSNHTTYAYCRTKADGKLLLHRFIMGLGNWKTDKRIINHKNGNGLDNRKENLEVCSNMYNSQSFRQPNRKNIGLIYYDTSMKRVKRWRVCLTVDGEKHHTRFETEEEARQYLATILIYLQ